MENCNDGLALLSMAVHERSQANLGSTKFSSRRCIKREHFPRSGKQAISHRQIEKKRRDRINNTLWKLKDIVPAAKLKLSSGSGRLEKADLLEMTIQYVEEIQRSLTDFQEKRDVDLAVGNQETLSEAYDNGFRDAMVKVLQLLPQSQPESTSQKTVKVGDWAEEIEEKQFTQSTTTDKLSSDDSSATIKSRSAFHVTNEQKEENAPTKLKDLNLEVIAKLIKKEESADFSNLWSNAMMHQGQVSSHQNDVVSSNAPAAFSPFQSSFSKQASVHMSNGLRDPILLPVYALHASGTHYVPVLLPPSTVLSKDALNTNH